MNGADGVDGPGGFERYTLRSVGIDIGSATSHIVLSRLEVRRLGSSLSSQFTVAEREITYRGDVLLTPYVTATLIDTPPPWRSSSRRRTGPRAYRRTRSTPGS